MVPVTGADDLFGPQQGVAVGLSSVLVGFSLTQLCLFTSTSPTDPLTASPGI